MSLATSEGATQEFDTRLATAIDGITTKLQVMEALESGRSRNVRTWTILLNRSSSIPLGIDLTRNLTVLLVKQGGTFAEWNSKQTSEVVQPGDQITEVNGIPVDEVYELAIRELQTASSLRLTFVRDLTQSTGGDVEQSASPRQGSPSAEPGLSTKSTTDRVSVGHCSAARPPAMTGSKDGRRVAGAVQIVRIAQRLREKLASERQEGGVVQEHPTKSPQDGPSDARAREAPWNVAEHEDLGTATVQKPRTASRMPLGVTGKPAISKQQLRNRGWEPPVQASTAREESWLLTESAVDANGEKLSVHQLSQLLVHAALGRDTSEASTLHGARQSDRCVNTVTAMSDAQVLGHVKPDACMLSALSWSEPLVAEKARHEFQKERLRCFVTIVRHALRGRRSRTRRVSPTLGI